MVDPSQRSGPSLPDGVVTFLLTDIEGSTALWEQAPEQMRPALARHDALFAEHVSAHGGIDVKPRGEGDSHFAVFTRPGDAVLAAFAIQRALATETWPTPRPIAIRIGLHTGEAELRDSEYYGTVVNRCARLRGIGHGGQVLLSQATADLVRDGLLPGLSLRDLGQHRLKDLTQPEHVSQLVAPDLPADFPPLTSLDARAHNLPVQPTTLLGREREVEDVRALLLGSARLVTLLGPGGTGKTRLGMQVAAELADQFEDGVFLVELAPISDPSLVPVSIVQALGVRVVGERTMLDTLKEHLRGRSLLLLLDNFEQILPAATVVAELLAASPGLRVLVTGRAPLRLRGEHEYPVPPLALPDLRQLPTPDALTRYPAVALFLERALTIRPGFALTDENAGPIATICTRLDGLPLAIELAAARVRLLTPRAMVDRLERRLPLLTGGARDLPTRQQTLRDTIAWSHDLLDEPERRLFRRLGVFVGGWTLEAAEAICRLDDADVDTLDGLDSLVAKSLVRQDEDTGGDIRFRLLETIREFALERLEASGEEAAIRRRHAEHFVALAEAARPHLGRSGGERWLDRLQTEHDNIRTVLAWSRTDQGDIHLGIRLAGAVARFWQIRSHLDEGLRWYGLLLPAARTTPDSSLARMLAGAGWLALVQGDVMRGAALFEEAVAVARSIGDLEGFLAPAVGNLGVALETRGDYEQAEQLLEESLAIYRRLGDTGYIAARLHNLGNVACAQGDFERATTLLEESVALHRQTGATYSLALAVGGLGLVALYQDDHERARSLSDQALTMFRDLDHPYGIAWSHYYLGRLELLRGDDGRAAALLHDSLELRRQLSDTGGVAQCLEGIAALASARHDAGRAARLFGAAASLRRGINAPLSPAERIAYERDLAAARAQLDESAFTAARAEGSALSMEQAVAYALSEAEPPA